MASKRSDQLHSYQFSVQRVVSALVMRDTDPAQSPFRRAAGATLASVLVAIIVAAGFGIYGVFSNRGDDGWQADGTVVIEKETGARFVYIDGKLHPALNLASAMLAHTGDSDKSPRMVSRKSLEEVPRGMPVGVPDLPDSLPSADRMVGLPWAVCNSSSEQPQSALVIGDGEFVAGGRRLPDDQGLFVRVGPNSKNGRTFLIFRGYRYEVAERVRATLVGDSALAVSPAFVNSITAGHVLDLPAISRIGKVSRTHPEFTNGQPVELQGSADKYAVVRDDGLATVTKLQFELLASTLQQKPIEIAREDVGSYTRVGTFVPDPTDPLQPPAVAPKPAEFGAGAVCAIITQGDGAVALRVEMSLELERATPTTGRDRAGRPYADYVFVAPGRGAIVATAQSRSLITDRGVRFPAADPQVLAELGYAGIEQISIRSSVIDLVPQGPALDPESARSQLIAGESGNA